MMDHIRSEMRAKSYASDAEVSHHLAALAPSREARAKISQHASAMVERLRAEAMRARGALRVLGAAAGALISKGGGEARRRRWQQQQRQLAPRRHLPWIRGRSPGGTCAGGGPYRGRRRRPRRRSPPCPSFS